MLQIIPFSCFVPRIFTLIEIFIDAISLAIRKKKSHFRVSTLSITGVFSEKRWRYETQRGSRVSARVKSLRSIIVHLVEWLSHLLVRKALTREEGRNRNSMFPFLGLSTNRARKLRYARVYVTSTIFS